jgi:glycosyltransferase involved in cell wall biosynthesis
MAVIEAMASGAPVVMTDVGVAREVVKDGITGLVVAIRDENALAGAIQRFLDDDSLRTTVVAAAKKEVKKLMSKEETFQSYKTSWEVASKNRKQ